MAKLDSFLNALSQYQADALVLEQGQPPAFRTAAGRRPVSKQVLEPDQLLQLISEMAPGDVAQEMRTQRSGRFEYELGPYTYAASLEDEAGKLVAVIQQTQSAEPSRDENGSPAVAAGEGADVGNGALDAAPRVNSPARTRMETLLQEMITRGASDLHLTCGTQPRLRIDGSLRVMEGEGTLSKDDLVPMMESIAPQRNRDEFAEKRDTDFGYAIEGVSRYRCNYFYDRLGAGAVFRAIPSVVPTAEELNLPARVRELALMNKGLVLVTGPTGSGKSTTLAAIVDLVNQKREDHIITIEDPIEFVHENKGCLVNQREVGVHTSSFKSALRAALREDPDVVLVGELRDLETVAIAVETAETGHLAFGTLHTNTAPSTVDRLIDQFPPDQQSQIRVMLSESLRAVISQTLVKKKGGGRVAALEILLGLPSVSNLIREGKTFQLPSTMQTGRTHGMQTLNDHLIELVKAGTVGAVDAYLKAVDKTGFEDACKRAGVKLDKPV